MKKYIAIQQYNEYSNDVVYDCLCDDIKVFFNTDIFILSNRDNKGVNDELINLLIDKLYNYSDYELEVYYNNHYVNYIIDTLKPYKRLSLKQAIDIMLLCKDNDMKKDVFIIKALNTIYRGDYTYTCLQGYSQSDWLYCFYNKATIKSDFIQYIEAVLFNTGIEVYILDEPTEIEGFDIDNYTNYNGFFEYMVDYYLIDDKKKYIASVIGCDVNDVAYYEIKDVKTITTHKIIYNEVK